MFKGSFTALITPFTESGINEAGFQSFVDWQIGEGVDGIVPVGTTGESPTLSWDEHKRVTELSVEVAKGRVPVIAGAGSNSTAEAVDFARHAHAVGADAILVVTPYYNKPTQEGLYQHFKAVAGAADIPLLIYNIPGRSVVDMSVETMARLARIPNVVGVKDATNDLARPSAIRDLIGPDFCQLSGEDATAAGYLAQGGHGCISVTSNVAPRLCAAMHNAWWAGDLKTFAEIRDKLAPLHRALFLESSPAPVKYAADLIGKAPSRVRLPLVGIGDDTKAAVRSALEIAGILS
ncbi:4-hydroxy-tetrahydrodipicolinate synthase [Fodinicurvata sp. EGI_FJ10296]|uniref:4-hydroxy-tetrahydrodipicolinate synthase n=1 Tax=Fodinicurvata sp. EGI_FJ10296 TaxID=3231908 RepID=UPI0034529D63